MKVGPRKINPSLYRRILEVLPIACVDIVLISNGHFLMVRRKNQPGRGKWCIPGGRVFKGETLKQAVLRKIQEETGLKNLKIIKLLTVAPFFSKTSAFGPSTHSINSVFLVRAEKQPLHLDNQSSEIKWFRKTNSQTLTYAKNIVKLVGFKQK